MDLCETVARPYPVRGEGRLQMHMGVVRDKTKGGAIRSDRGANLVEFAILMPLLLLLALGIVELGWKFGQFNDVRHAVREGARLAAVAGATDMELEARICSALDLVDAGITQVEMAWTPDADTDGNTDIGEPGSIRVEVDASSLTNAPVISAFLPQQLASEIEFRLEQPPGGVWSTRALSVATC